MQSLDIGHSARVCRRVDKGDVAIFAVVGAPGSRSAARHARRRPRSGGLHASDGPAFEREQDDDPGEDEANGRDRHVEESHHVVCNPVSWLQIKRTSVRTESVAHGRETNLLGREDEDHAAARQADGSQRLCRRSRGENADRWSEPKEGVRRAAQHGEPGKKNAPKRVDGDLELVFLVMGGHGDAGHADDESRERVEAERVRRRRGDGRERTAGLRRDGGAEEASNRGKLEQHAHQPGEPKPALVSVRLTGAMVGEAGSHDGDANVLHRFDVVRLSRARAEPFEPRVGGAIEEDDEALDEFGRRHLVAVRATIGRRLAVPAPAVLGERSEVASPCEDAVPVLR